MRASARWSAQQLTEFVGVVGSQRDVDLARRSAAEQIAEAFEAEVCAILGSGRLLAVVGFPRGAEPSGALEEVAAGKADELDVPGVGPCFTLVAVLEDGAHIVVGRSGDEFSREETGMLRGMARVLDIVLSNLGRLAREREVVDQLRALDEMKSAILSAVSHELRTPLTVVLGLSRTLEERGAAMSPDDQSELVARLTANAQRLERLLADLLDIDRLTRGVIEPRRVTTYLPALIDRAVEGADIAPRRGIEIDVPPMIVDIDAGKVERIVENLIVNASKYSAPGEPITIRARPAGSGGVLIVVEDRGKGIPRELHGEIFEPFRQGPNVKPHAPGVGIGLSLVARFAELHGGEAWVEDRPGGGSSFHVMLPGPPKTDDADRLSA